ncbi:helix-turn-helix domain-containing protein [Nocardiopsis sp. NPDC006938]|uniref:helix-turn-helix domain-containing protein n=1 Tax=Nocardiopsis sp. NPDC006938 TaxID=3364337 RepID=UPI00367C343B
MTTEDTVPYPVVLRAPDVDWIKFDAELARDGSVEPVVKALYAALASFADQVSRDTDETVDEDEIPTRKRLAKCIGKSVDTVDRAIKKLEEIHLLEVERRKDPTNPRSNIPSVYRLLDRERWDERAGERAAKRRAERERKRQEAEQAKREQAARDRAEAEKQQEEAPETGPDHPCGEDCGGWPHGCGQGGRMGAARVAAWVRPGWPHGCGGTSSSQEGSSSSSGESAEPEEEDGTPSAKKPRRVGAGVALLQDMTGATVEEAQAVIARLRVEAKRLTGREIGSVRRYLSGFDPEDLDPHLKAVRAQRAPEARTEAPGVTGADRTCLKHHVPLDCPVCAGLSEETVRGLLNEYGPVRRPDLARRFPEPAHA